MDGLARELGWPLDESVLGRVTVTQLRKALGQAKDDRRRPRSSRADRFPVALLKEVVEMLWGQKEDEVAESPWTTTRTARCPAPVRIAVACDRAEQIDAHFGSASQYLVYQVSTTEIRLIDVRRVDGPIETRAARRTGSGSSMTVTCFWSSRSEGRRRPR